MIENENKRNSSFECRRDEEIIDYSAFSSYPASNCVEIYFRKTFLYIFLFERATCSDDFQPFRPIQLLEI